MEWSTCAEEKEYEDDLPAFLMQLSKEELQNIEYNIQQNLQQKKTQRLE